MKWIVLEENPMRDNYIAVVLAATFKKLKIESRAHSVYSTCDEAMARARQLRSQFGVQTIRIFNSDSA